VNAASSLVRVTRARVAASPCHCRGCGEVRCHVDSGRESTVKSRLAIATALLLAGAVAALYATRTEPLLKDHEVKLERHERALETEAKRTTALEERVGSVEKKVVEQDARVGKVEGDAKAARETAEAEKAEIAKLQEQLKALEARSETTTQEVAKLRAMLADLEARREKQQKELEKRLDTLEKLNDGKVQR
jgi:chromosome segregation ATPase